MKITINLDEWTVTEERNPVNIKLVALKGEKGDTGADGTVSFDSLTPAQKAELKGEDGDDYILTEQDKQDIADLVTQEDTGWVDQTISTTGIDRTTTWVQARRIGDIVCVRGMIKTSSNLAVQGEVTACTLDSDFRPSGIMRMSMGAYDSLWTVSINTDGTIVERNSSSTAATKSNRFFATYIV